MLDFQNLAIDSNNKYNQKNFYEHLENIIELFDALANNIKRQNIIDKYEKALKSDAIIEKKIFEEINKQFNSVNLLKEKLDQVYKYTTLNQIACYNNIY